MAEEGTMAKKKKQQPKLGSGKRFSNLEKSLKRQGAKNPGALAASIGRKKYGNKRMNQMARTGQRRAAKRGK
jgi:hypothetical protein